MAEKRKTGRKTGLFFLVTGVIFVAFLFVKKNNVVRWAGALLTIREQNEAIERYESDIRRMEDQITALSTDRDSLETFAREYFHFAKPDEDVYITDEKR